jgi:hypothetical protein
MTSFATLVDWAQPLLELAGFLASFLATGLEDDRGRREMTACSHAHFKIAN